jgi:hypothetical protein
LKAASIWSRTSIVLTRGWTTMLLVTPFTPNRSRTARAAPVDRALQGQPPVRHRHRDPVLGDHRVPLQRGHCRLHDFGVGPHVAAREVDGQVVRQGLHAIHGRHRREER